MLLWLPPDSASSASLSYVMDRRRSGMDGWETGGSVNIYSDADAPDKYDNQTRLIMFSWNIIYLPFKIHLLVGKEARQYHGDKKRRVNGWRLK